MSNMLSYDEALSRVVEKAKSVRLPFENVPIAESCGRVLAADAITEICNPAFDNSAMDGFAIRAADVSKATAQHPVELTCHGHILAGDEPFGQRYDEPLKDAASAICFEIMTGAPLPQTAKARLYCDAVVRIEDVQILQRDGENVRKIAIKAPVPVGSSIRCAGEDFVPGAVLGHRGSLVTPEIVMALAAGGLSFVAVTVKPKIAIIVTGSEIVAHDKKAPIPASAVRNSSGPFLHAAFLARGCDVLQMTQAGDDLDALRSSLRDARESGAHVIVTTGAVSMGKRDLVGEAILAEGGRIDFHKVAIRPGKPIMMADFSDGAVIFGLPGNPISTAVGMHFFVTPFLRTLRHEMALEARRGVLGEEWPRKLPSDLTCFLRAKLDDGDGADFGRVSILNGQDSFMVKPLAEATGWAVVPAGAGPLYAGTAIRFVPFSSGSL